MSEKIGQVVLDDTYYPGKDLYTDGAIEDEMLEIAQKLSGGRMESGDRRAQKLADPVFIFHI